MAKKKNTKWVCTDHTVERKIDGKKFILTAYAKGKDGKKALRKRATEDKHGYNVKFKDDFIRPLNYRFRILPKKGKGKTITYELYEGYDGYKFSI